MPVEAFGGRGIVSADEILRGDLGAILYEAARPGVSYLFNDTITDLKQDADGVLVSFENADPRRFDLVVGADGLNSAVRRLGPRSGQPSSIRSVCSMPGSLFPLTSTTRLVPCTAPRPGGLHRPGRLRQRRPHSACDRPRRSVEATSVHARAA
jgi:2-polyprenyl-6-methoxyphenol hydroxylase-like FAD-dependent oxidoreductase